MNKVISTEKSPIKLWLDDMEDGALEQAKNLANLPFLHKWVSIMPDAHQGYGMPIGGVIATEGVVIPNAVGVDIGCGMCAVKTSLKEIETETLKKILGEIRDVIPVGFNHQKEIQNIDLMPGVSELDKNTLPVLEYAKSIGMIVRQEFMNATKQIGSLGGGNHFVEIQKGDDGHIWIMIHSGSRNIGYKVAEHYNKVAIELNEKWFSSIPKEHQLAFLPMNTNEGKNYIKEMNYCVEFALANRKLMMDRVKDCFIKFFDTSRNGLWIDEDIINIAHNYARLENHVGKNVWVHRKGATSAKEGEIGIIPGSQGTKSYIVRGKGNPESFTSCSHGAGRKMGRKEAQRTLNLEEEKKKLEDKGILHSIRGTRDLDEAPGSYKNISKVMENQKDLVDIVVELNPLGVVKG